jgi:hypothetical protein
MPLIAPKGSPASPVWIILDRPFSSDIEKGYLLSGGMGFVWDKIMREAGMPNYYATCLHPDTDDFHIGGSWESYLQSEKPPIIIPLDSAGKALLPEMIPQPKKKGGMIAWDASNISKYCGSIQTSDRISWPHYVIPTYGPQEIIKQWKMRDIVINCDLGKAAAELEYWNQHKALQPLPEIEAKIDFDSFDELLYIIDSFRDSEYISNDIETIYPKPPTKTIPSQFYKILPGYPVTIGLSRDNKFGVSFNLFRDSTVETRELWKRLARLLADTPSVGQNFFNFDANFYECLGFKLPLDKCRDTMILHHLLWAELPHKLQFLARQYTRHPYWKDEGAGWSPKNMKRMKIYNVKDVCATMEIFWREREEAIARGIYV